MAVQLKSGTKILLALIGILLIVIAIKQFGYLDNIISTSSEGDKKPVKLPEKVLDKVRQVGVLKVGMEPDAPPMYYHENGQPVGFDYEIANEIGRAIGVNEVKIIEANYNQLPDLLRRGEIDLMMGGYVPDPSIENVEWSDGYLEFGLCLIVKRSSAITDHKQLANKIIGIYDDPAAEAWVRENISSPKAVKKYSGSGWFSALDKNEVDAIIYDYPFAVAEIKKFPKLKIVKLNLNASRYAVGVVQNNDPLLSAVNRAISDFMKNERYGQIVQKYLNTQSIETQPVAKGSKIYIVKAGDTLTKIAAKELGNADDWGKIWNLNKNRLANPHLLFVGFQLLMP